MQIRNLVGVAALTLAAALAVPALAEAGHRHSRRCGHHVEAYRHYRSYPSYDYSRDYDDGYDYGRYYDQDYDYRRPHYGHHYSYYDDYDYRPHYRVYSRVYRPRVSFHYHGRARCYRRHVGVHIGW